MSAMRDAPRQSSVGPRVSQSRGLCESDKDREQQDQPIDERGRPGSTEEQHSNQAVISLSNFLSLIVSSFEAWTAKGAWIVKGAKTLSSCNLFGHSSKAARSLIVIGNEMAAATDQRTSDAGVARSSGNSVNAKDLNINMPPSPELPNRGTITYESAVEHESDVISQLSYVPATKKLYSDLLERRHTIEALVAHHLGLNRRARCIVLGTGDWLQGSFNVCIPVVVESTSSSVSEKVLVRCPMPHKLAEARYPGTMDEKISCEVGMYAWMQRNCRQVRIPHLYGFGLSDGRNFIHVMHQPFYVRLLHTIRHHIYELFHLSSLSKYTRSTTEHSLPSGYMILEFVEESTGEMLSDTWNMHREDPARRQRLFSGMSRLILSLARVPQLRIGSFRFNDDGTVTMTNRPLSCSAMILENNGAPRVMERNDTYTCTEAWVSDMLTLHDNRFLSQQNAVWNSKDCHSQMAVQTLLRALSHHYIRREHRNGPFLLQFTDFHASNLLVDKEWNITCLIDLEWICSLPAEMLDLPYWLTGLGIDEIENEQFDEYHKVREEFMRIFEEEERRSAADKKHELSLATIIHDMWTSKGVWFWHCISSINGMYSLYDSHINPIFGNQLPIEDREVMSRYWCENSQDVIAKKLEDRQRYDQGLRCAFGKPSAVEV